MASYCSRCGKQLSFRDSFVWEKKPICGACLKEVEHGQGWENVPETSEPDLSNEGMTGGEWLGAFFCTPYGLIKYFDWKKKLPEKQSRFVLSISLPIRLQ